MRLVANIIGAKFLRSKAFHQIQKLDIVTRYLIQKIG